MKFDEVFGGSWVCVVYNQQQTIEFYYYYLLRQMAARTHTHLLNKK